MVMCLCLRCGCCRFVGVAKAGWMGAFLGLFLDSAKEESRGIVSRRADKVPTVNAGFNATSVVEVNRTAGLDWTCFHWNTTTNNNGCEDSEASFASYSGHRGLLSLCSSY
jgi:hypothetical protein